MDKTTDKLLKKYGVTEEALNNTQVTLQFDMSGRLDFLKEVQSMGVNAQQSNDKNAGGGLSYDIISNLNSALGVLGIMISKFGSDVQVAIFVAALGTYVIMTAVKAREYLIKKAGNK